MDVRSADPVLTRPRRGPAAAEWVAATGVGALGVAALLSPDAIEDGPVICPFRLLTGLPCPGCGLTRSWVHLVHGGWQESLLAHPFGAVAVVLLVALVVAVVAARVRGRQAPDLTALVRRPWLRVVLGAWLAFATVRLVVVLAGG